MSLHTFLGTGGGNRVRGGGEKNLGVIFRWRILILDAPAKHLCQQNFAVATPEKGLTICHTGEIVQSAFSDGLLIVRYINKMGTYGGGGVVDVVPLRRLQAILVPG